MENQVIESTLVEELVDKAPQQGWFGRHKKLAVGIGGALLVGVGIGVKALLGKKTKNAAEPVDVGPTED